MTTTYSGDSESWGIKKNVSGRFAMAIYSTSCGGTRTTKSPLQRNGGSRFHQGANLNPLWYRARLPAGAHIRGGH